MRKARNVFVLFLFLAGATYIFVHFYSYIFSRKVAGVITAVERVVPPMAIVTGGAQMPNPQIFSFAVGVKDTHSGDIVTGSSEDRQWAVARPGQCVEAEFFPYPPWEFQKWGTYFNVRLLRLRDCGGPIPPGSAPQQFRQQQQEGMLPSQLPPATQPQPAQPEWPAGTAPVGH